MGSAKALGVLGWLVIILGIIAGIVVINQFGKVEAFRSWAIGFAVIIWIVLWLAFPFILVGTNRRLDKIISILSANTRAKVDAERPAPAAKHGEKSDASRFNKGRDYIPEHGRPTENDQLAMGADKICSRCKHFSAKTMASYGVVGTVDKGLCGVFDQEVTDHSTCKHFRERS